MPYRVLHYRRDPRWPDTESCGRAIALLDEWLEILDGIGHKSFRADIGRLRIAIGAEYDKHAAQEQYAKQLRRYEQLQSMGMDVAAPLPCGALSCAESNSLDQIKQLVTRATDGSITKRLVPETLLPFELGRLISVAMSGRLEESEALRIAELVRKLTSNEWLTGSLAPGAGSIHSIVQSRIVLLDELLSTQPWPAEENAPASPSGHVGRAVVAQLRPYLDQIQENLSHFGYASRRDAVTERTRPTPKLLTPNAAAKKFGVSAYALRREHAAGRIEGCHVGTHLRLVEESVAEWCRGTCKTAEGGQGSPQQELQGLPRKPPSFI